MYRTQLTGRATLTPERERELAGLYRAGNREAGRTLIEACLPFVMTVANEYRRWGLPMEDVVQGGDLGLFKAAERFDPDRGCRLATYAAYWIRAESASTSPAATASSASAPRRASAARSASTGRRTSVTPGILAQQSGLSAARATELLPLLMARDV